MQRILRKDTDRRKVRITLTRGGRKFLDEFLPVHYKKMMTLTECLDPAERETLNTLLGKIEEGLKDFGK